MQIPDTLLHYFLRFLKYITIKHYQSTPSHFYPQHLPKWNWKLLNRLITKHLTGSFVLGTIANSPVQFSSLLCIDIFWCFLMFHLVTNSKRRSLISIISHPNSGFCIYPSKHFLFTSSNTLSLYQWLYFSFFCTIITGIFTTIPMNSLDPNSTGLCPYLVYGHSSKHPGVFLHSAPFYLPFISFSYHLNFQKCSKFLR